MLSNVDVKCSAILICYMSPNYQIGALIGKKYELPLQEP